MHMDCIDFISKVKGIVTTKNITIMILNSNNVVSQAIYTTMDDYIHDIMVAKAFYRIDVIDFWFEENKLLLWAKRRKEEAISG